MVNDPDFCRIYYVRYADDWMIGVVGSKELASAVKSRATQFLAENLKLELSEEKTLITHAKSDEASFLGFRLSVGDSVKRRMVETEGKRTTLKRVTGWQPRVDVPTLEIVSRLSKSGFCHSVKGKTHFPCSKKSFVALEDHEIVLRYNSVWRGVYNYYCISNNAHKLRWVMYILQYSCLMTLSHKHRIRVPRAIRKYGVFPRITYKGADGEPKDISFWRPPTWRQVKSPSERPLDINVLVAKTGRLTRSRLGSPCAVCGNPHGVEMHHVRALRKGNKTIANGFNRIMSAINRKQLPVCRSCHDGIHAGRYDGVKLSDLAYIPQ
ncbi:group II intron reverse transcriptase/maturase [Pseudomonas sp. FeN3W]|nr:group II intron reverse transcriptase/maturase [Pseudomonas sp. FeN3W]